MKFFIFFFLFVISIPKLYQQEIVPIETLIKENQYEEIINNYSKYEDNASHYPEINYYLGIAYFKTKNYKKAEEIFSKIENSDFETPQVYFNLGIVNYKLGKYKKTIYYLGLAEKLDLSLAPKCLYLKIGCYIKLNKKEKAIETYKELLQKFPNSWYILKSEQLLEQNKINYKKHKKILELVVSSELGYDNNINTSSLETVLISNNTDTYYSMTLTPTINLSKLSLTYDYTTIAYSSYTQYNTSLHTFFLTYNLKNISLGIFNKFLSYTQLFNNVSGIELTLTQHQTIPTKFKISLYNTNYKENEYEELNSITYSMTLETIFNKKSNSFIFGFDIERNQAENIYYSWYSFIPYFKYSNKNLVNFLKIKSDLNYEIKTYDYERKDSIITFNLSIPINIYQNLQLVPSYIYIINNSNISYFSYQKYNLVISLSLSIF